MFFSVYHGKPFLRGRHYYDDVDADGDDDDDIRDDADDDDADNDDDGDDGDDDDDDDEEEEGDKMSRMSFFRPLKLTSVINNNLASVSAPVVMK